MHTTRKHSLRINLQLGPNRYLLTSLSIIIIIYTIKILGINIVPVSSWTMEREGSTSVAIAGATDKRQITAVFC